MGANDAQATREQIADYLRHVFRTDIGTVLSSQARNVVGLVAGWVENGLDVEWAREVARHKRPNPGFRSPGEGEE